MGVAGETSEECSEWSTLQDRSEEASGRKFPGTFFGKGRVRICNRLDDADGGVVYYDQTGDELSSVEKVQILKTNLTEHGAPGGVG